MALSNMRQWDQYEHPMGEHLEQERVLNAIDQLFEDSNLFPATKEKFPDLIERSTAAVRESVAGALDRDRGKRIDHPTEEHDGKGPMSQQILESESGSKTEPEKGRLNKEFFGKGFRGWLSGAFRKVHQWVPLIPASFRREPAPRRQAEFLLEPKESRGLKTFAQREVLSATYFLEPERAERIIREKIEAEVGLPKDQQYATNMMNLLEKRLGVDVWNERQAYPGIRFAMAFIANLILHPPPGGFDIKDVEKFVKDALGGEFEYEKTVREAKQAESDYKLMESKINKAETHVNDLMKLAEELTVACQGTNFKDKKTDLENGINLLKSGEKTVEVISLEELQDELTKALKEASGKEDDPNVIEAKRKLNERTEKIKGLKKDLKKASGATKADFENQLVILKQGKINVKKLSVGDLRITLDAALETSDGKENTSVIEARKELVERENEIKTREEELKKLKSLQKSIEGKRALLEQFINTLEKPEKPEDESEARKEMLKFITDMQTGNDGITDTANKLIAYELSERFETYASELRAKLKSNLEVKKAEKEKALKAAEEVKDVKLTPEELVYKLFHHYFTHRKEEGGFLDDKIPKHWISKDNTPFMNNLRDRALLATRFAISEAKDQAVFAQLYANRGLAEHALAQQSRWGRFMEWGRSSWIGNKIATTFGRPEQVSFDKILERIRTITTTKDGKPHKPFANLELKWITTRGDLRKAIETKKLDENELPRLASYLEMILKESDKIEIRPKDAEMFYRTIRNLKLVRQEMLHEKFMLEVNRTPGSMPEKLRDLWKNKWAAEEQLDMQMVDEARKREFIAFLEKETFDKLKKQTVNDIITNLRKGEIDIDGATTLLANMGYKVGKFTGLGLWSRWTGRGAKEYAKEKTVAGAKAVGGKVKEKLAPVAKKLGIEKKSDVIYKPLGFFGWTVPKTAVWNVPKGILWSSKIRGKEHAGVLKYVWRGLKDVTGAFGETIGVSKAKA